MLRRQKISKHIFILAGSHKQASYFARTKSLLPSHWTFLHRSEQLSGLRGRPYIKYGTLENLKGVDAIMDMIALQEMQECADVHPLT